MLDMSEIERLRIGAGSHCCHDLFLFQNMFLLFLQYTPDIRHFTADSRLTKDPCVISRQKLALIQVLQ